MDSTLYKDIFEKSTDGMLIIKDNKFVECNPSVVKMLQYESKDQLLNTHPSELSPEFQPDGRSSYEKVEENTAYVLKHGNRTFEWVHLRANGEPFWVEVVLTDISTDQNMIFLTVWREIGEKKELEAEKAYQSMILNSVINATPDLIFYKDYSNEDGKYMGCNDAFSKFVGKSKEEIVGHNDIELFGKQLGDFFREKDANVLKSKTAIVNEEWVVYPDGTKVLLHTHKSIFSDKNGSVIGIVGVSRDITENNIQKTLLEKSIEENKKLANTDSLTGIANRRSFFEIGEHIFKIAHRTKQPFSLLMIDIDYFKSINDTYGHLIGDEILKFITESIKCRLRESDIFSRFGGEEFMILLPDTEIEGAIEIAKVFHNFFNENVYSDNLFSIPVKVSIGVVQYKNELLLRELIKNVDDQLYKAKNNGRNRIEADI